MGHSVVLDPPEELAVGRRKKDAPESVSKVQVNVKLVNGLAQEFLVVAKGLGLDLANFVRMIIAENLGTYRARLDQAKRKGGQEGKP